MEGRFIACPASQGSPLHSPQPSSCWRGERLELRGETAWLCNASVLLYTDSHLASLGPRFLIHKMGTESTLPSQDWIVSEEPGAGPIAESVPGHQSCLHSLVSECSRLRGLARPGLPPCWPLLSAWPWPHRPLAGPGGSGSSVIACSFSIPLLCWFPPLLLLPCDLPHQDAFLLRTELPHISCVPPPDPSQFPLFCWLFVSDSAPHLADAQATNLTGLQFLSHATSSHQESECVTRNCF